MYRRMNEGKRTGRLSFLLTADTRRCHPLTHARKTQWGVQTVEKAIPLRGACKANPVRMFRSLAAREQGEHVVALCAVVFTPGEISVSITKRRTQQS